MPKVNLYQSLHTTVIGPDGKPLEVQIRTEEMHRLAESGIAAHWRYKEGSSAMDVPWVGDIRDPARNRGPPGVSDQLSSSTSIRTRSSSSPRPATSRPCRGGPPPIDFAYAVHTEVGNRCVGVRINGRLLASLDQARIGRHRRGHHLEGGRRRAQPRLAELRHARRAPRPRSRPSSSGSGANRRWLRDGS